MSENQTNTKNQQTDNKTNQPSQDGNKKETNPNNPTANQTPKPGSQPRTDSNSTSGKVSTSSPETEENDEETADTTHGAQKQELLTPVKIRIKQQATIALKAACENAFFNQETRIISPRFFLH
ncbi:MAG: hypothetical protein IPG90_06615 [Bacteroidetes bacterium]|nr:hypothetical protein [Bacteroidota bacterium]